MSIYDNAGVALIPSGTKASKLYSVLPANGDGDFTHDRNLTTATRVNKDGFIEGVAADVPRLDYPLIDGVVQDCPALLLEPSRTNDIQRTEEFDNSYWTKYDTSVSANQVISPDGAVTADKLIEDTGTSNHMIGRSFSFTSGTTYAVSVFVKENGRDLEIAAGNPNVWRGSAKYNLSTGSVKSEDLGTASIENFGNGWYRCVLVAEAIATSSTNILFKLVSGTSTSYTGDGSSGVYLWGAQREVGSYPTSYISWDGSGSTTRSADVCNGSGTSAEFNDSEGVLFAEIQALANDSTNRIISVSDGSGNNRALIKYDNSSNTIEASLTDGGVDQASLSNSYDILNTAKISFKYNSNDFALWVNGFEVDTDSSGATPSGLDTLNFDNGSGGSDFYGKTKQLMTFKTALTDSELETLTSWDSFNAMAKGQLYTIE